MKRFVIALLGVLVMSAVIAAAAAVNKYQVTGPVLELKADSISVQKGKDVWELGRDANTKVNGDLKKGKKVEIKYRMIATEITVK
jgi:uncharacterized protein YxeA